jgi:hypothetical protein
VNTNWVPVSASALVIGALSLWLGSLMLPEADDARATLDLVEQLDGQWLAIALLFFLAGIGILLGLPAIIVLFVPKVRWLGLTALGVFVVGASGTTGYAMLLVFLRALVQGDAIVPDAFNAAVSEPGLWGFLIAWIGAFYLGELLLAVTLLRARTTPRWVPLLLLAHVLVLPVSNALPEWARDGSTLLLVVGLVGIAVTANGSLRAPTLSQIEGVRSQRLARD